MGSIHIPRNKREREREREIGMSLLYHPPLYKTHGKQATRPKERVLLSHLFMVLNGMNINPALDPQISLLSNNLNTLKKPLRARTHPIDQRLTTYDTNLVRFLEFI
jgi:hypothetical protein